MHIYRLYDPWVVASQSALKSLDFTLTYHQLTDRNQRCTYLLIASLILLYGFLRMQMSGFPNLILNSLWTIGIQYYINIYFFKFINPLRPKVSLIFVDRQRPMLFCVLADITPSFALYFKSALTPTSYYIFFNPPSRPNPPLRSSKVKT